MFRVRKIDIRQKLLRRCHSNDVRAPNVVVTSDVLCVTDVPVVWFSYCAFSCLILPVDVYSTLQIQECGDDAVVGRVFGGERPQDVIC